MDKLLTQLGIAKEDKDLRKEIALYLLREVAQSGILKQEMVDDQGAARGQIGQFYTVQVSKPGKCHPRRRCSVCCWRPPC